MIVSGIIVCLLITVFFPVSAQNSALNIKIVRIDDSAFPIVKAYVSVFDSQGFSITGLDSKAFQVSEDQRLVNTYQVVQFENFEQPLAVVLIIDTSGSMYGKPLTDSISAAKNFIADLMPDDLVSIISFSNSINVVQQLTSNHVAAIQVLDTLEAQGDTALYDSIIEAISLLKNRSERQVILLLTDGKESGISKFDFDQVINEAVRWSTPVYPIGFGRIDKNELERLAILTGGFSQINPDTTTLPDSFKKVMGNLREQYLVEYSSLIQADGLNHNLDISIEHQNGLMSTSSNFIARPGDVTVFLPDLFDGKEVSGEVLFTPQVLSPATIKRMDLSIDGQQLSHVQAPPFEYVWDSSAVSLGDHVIEITITDEAGNVGSKIIGLKVIPAVQVTTSILHDQVVSGKYLLAAAVIAQAGIAQVEFSLDGQLLAATSSPPYEVLWDTRKVSPGYHQIQIKATDVNGYTGEIVVRVIVEVQRSTNLLWMTLILILSTTAIMVPIGLRKNKAKKQLPPDVNVVETVVIGNSSDTGAKLIETEGLNPGQIWPLAENEVRMGRKRDENDIPLKGLTASRQQAVIRHQTEGFVLYSLKPDNLMIVNETPVLDHVVLQHGDRIRAGDSIFIFEVQG